MRQFITCLLVGETFALHMSNMPLLFPTYCRFAKTQCWDTGVRLPLQGDGMNTVTTTALEQTLRITCPEFLKGVIEPCKRLLERKIKMLHHNCKNKYRKNLARLGKQTGSSLTPLAHQTHAFCPHNSCLE